jgi:hypothetical protein
METKKIMNVTGNEFLNLIGLIKPGESEYEIKFTDGTSIFLGDILEEYAKLNKTI